MWVKIEFNLLVQFGQVFLGFPSNWHVGGWFPFPAGKLLGWTMFFNLLAAHAIRFKLTWKRSGIFILHAGVVTLLIGEYITREWQVEQRMVIDEGGMANYAFDTKSSELAFSTPGEGKAQNVTVIPSSQLQAAAKAKEETHLAPGRARRCRSARVHAELQDDEGPVPIGPVDHRCGQDSELRSARVGRIDPGGLGDRSEPDRRYPRLHRPALQEGIRRPRRHLRLGGAVREAAAADHRGKKFDLELRWTRHYKPFLLQLQKFTHEKYPGTQIPKAYISRVRIIDPERNVDREVDISMNEPLRYRGEAFFQAGFDEGTEKTTILQVVRNPGWTMPYIACFLVTLGLLIHFGIFLTQYLIRLKPTGQFRAASANAVAGPPQHWAIRFAPLFAAAVALLYIGSNLFSRTTDGNLDLTNVGRVPVQEGGRYKPLDTVARTSMRQVSRRESYVNSNGKDRPRSSGTSRRPAAAKPIQARRSRRRSSASITPNFRRSSAWSGAKECATPSKSSPRRPRNSAKRRRRRPASPTRTELLPRQGAGTGPQRKTPPRHYGRGLPEHAPAAGDRRLAELRGGQAAIRRRP